MQYINSYIKTQETQATKDTKNDRGSFSIQLQIASNIKRYNA